MGQKYTLESDSGDSCSSSLKENRWIEYLIKWVNFAVYLLCLNKKKMEKPLLGSFCVPHFSFVYSQMNINFSDPYKRNDKVL